MSQADTAATAASDTPKVSWGREFMASVVVFLVALPLCMGIAIASGVPPALGLISGIIGGLLIGLFAGSPLQVSGPAAGLAVLVWELVQTHGLAALGVAVFIGGVFQVLAGVLRLGRWFRAVSPALIQGMLAGIGVLIFASQFHVMVDDKPAGSGLTNLVTIPQAIANGISPAQGASHQLAAIIGLLTIGTIIVWNKFRPAKLKVVPAPLVAVVVASAVANIAGFQVNFVTVPESLIGSLNMPTVAIITEKVADTGFLMAAVGMGLVASAETLLCATATDRLSQRSKTNYDKELIAQGVGNATAGVLGALPITGVIVRSTANVEAGATTRWSAVAHGAWLLILVAALPFVLTSVPTASLAAVLVFTGYKLANPMQVKALWQAGRGEALVFGVTVVAIVSTNLLTGVLIGLGCALAKLLISMARIQAKVQEQGSSLDVRLTGAATFVGLPKLAATLESLTPKKDVRVHVGDLDYIDHACLELIDQWKSDYERKGGHVVLLSDHADESPESSSGAGKSKRRLEVAALAGAINK